jgi:predicted nucleotidyltransferase
MDETLIAKIKQYLATLPTVGIHASRAVLFGPYARGEADRNSDVDLIVVAPEFDDESDVEIIKGLWEITLLADNRIEPIPCGEREWEMFRRNLAYLTDCAVSFRYPGESADTDSAAEALRSCRAFRIAARRSLGLDV